MFQLNNTAIGGDNVNVNMFQFHEHAGRHFTMLVTEVANDEQVTIPTIIPKKGFYLHHED